MPTSKLVSLGVAVACLALMAACAKAPAAAPNSQQAGSPASGGSKASSNPANPSSGRGAAPLTSWCAAGTTWSGSGFAGSGGQGQYESKIVGIEQYKGKSYCKAEYTVDAPGQKGTVTYYFNEDSSDVWMLMDMNGQKQEFHMGR